MASTASSSDSQVAGYLAASSKSPLTSAHGNFVIPSFTCTDVQYCDMSIQLVSSSGGDAAGFLDVNCSGAGQRPALSGVA